ncbi:hypothetical protein LTR10_020754 [Elasticomyces elasticus]|uniref:SnoaL-like domain-containing protein n=1 Tax=Exophiala sideris TaxID=1016849 RepID=A0ABR0J6D3_9EURO|nr:hypothetical protein LTR10_020754 [Elasticomyces elasticus]KAK5028861.1 hypothetical protein LTS07_006241 [Exophiala sideris]KAK5035730.1 hypothetical protein LTR13_005860 [Exophiala sideris]KAK5057365.1 hypothetical protein LTR69_007405 [Exophiala sideris]KAK5181661.1 hypothetical protein LTR44_005860 [Eurotiomycetes sp. CCFEE 6388]
MSQFIPTKPAFVHYGDWDDTTRKDPSQKWQERITHDIFDSHKWDTPYSDMQTDDATLLKPDGTHVHGGKASWAAIAELFRPLTSQITIPFYMVVTETEYGWEMIGTANIFGNLPGEPAAGEVKVKDDYGKEWDVKISGGFRFQYRKVDGAKYDGILCQLIQMFTDSGPMVTKMLKRGLLKPGDLGLA